MTAGENQTQAVILKGIFKAILKMVLFIELSLSPGRECVRLSAESVPCDWIFARTPGETGTSNIK
jgi:hypothetical protein